MAIIKGVYKCSICGNIIEVLKDGQGDPVCCGQKMELLTEHFENEGQEKHLPLVQVDGSRVSVKVGSVLHPMEDDHYIQWIEIIGEKQTLFYNFKPGDTPELVLDFSDRVKKVRAYCNKHGLWVKSM